MEKKETLVSINIEADGQIGYVMNVVVTEAGEIVSESKMPKVILPTFQGDKASLPELVQKAIEIYWTPEIKQAWQEGKIQSA